MGNASAVLTVKKISVAQEVESVPKSEESAHKTATGFLLMDSSLRPAWVNAEAFKILGYPDKLAKLRQSDILLASEIRSSLASRQPGGESPFVTEFRSGRRRYSCRAFLLDSYASDPSHPCIAVVLERGLYGPVPLSQVSRQFNLTERERESLPLLRCEYPQEPKA